MTNGYKKPTKQLNIAMIGHGFMGRAHSNAFLQVGKFFDSPYELVLKVICGRDGGKLKEMADKWGWSETSSDWRAVVERDDIDIVDIATPNSLHAEIAIRALEHNKIVFCEKPLAMSVEEAELMTAAAKGLPTLVWFNYRRVPAIALAKRFIDEGKLGTAYHYRAAYLQSWGSTTAPLWRFDPGAAGSGAIGDLLAHSIDTALHLNGNIVRVSAMTKTFSPSREVDDAVWALAEFDNGSRGTFEASRFATGYDNYNSFSINGSGGMIKFNLEDMNRLEIFDAHETESDQGLKDVLVTRPNHPYVRNFWPPGHIIGYEHTFIFTLFDFLAALKTQTEFHPNFEDALRVQRILHAVELSAKDGKWLSS